MRRAAGATKRPVDFVVIGTGPLKPALEAQSERLGAGVKFEGYKRPAELRCYFRRMAMLVFPSLYPEAFGMVNVEAMLLETLPSQHQMP